MNGQIDRELLGGSLSAPAFLPIVTGEMRSLGDKAVSPPSRSLVRAMDGTGKQGQAPCSKACGREKLGFVPSLALGAFLKSERRDSILDGFFY